MKIHRIVKNAATHQLLVQDMGTHMNAIPIIPLKGKWLSREAGIYPRDTVQIDVQPERITITLIKKADPSEQYPWQRRDWVKPKPTPSTGTPISIPKV